MCATFLLLHFHHVFVNKEAKKKSCSSMCFVYYELMYTQKVMKNGDFFRCFLACNGDPLNYVSCFLIFLSSFFISSFTSPGVYFSTFYQGLVSADTFEKNYEILGMQFIYYQND